MGILPIDGFLLRKANSNDAELIVNFIRELAEFEDFASLLTVTVKKISISLFDKEQASCVIGEYHNNPVCFCIFYRSYSVLTGQANMHVEALFVLPEHRNKGFGKLTLWHVAKLAFEEGCQRVDWACLKWNTSAISFYRGIGAIPLNDRDTYRLEGKALDSFISLRYSSDFPHSLEVSEL